MNINKDINHINKNDSKINDIKIVSEYYALCYEIKLLQQIPSHKFFACNPFQDFMYAAKEGILICENCHTFNNNGNEEFNNALAKLYFILADEYLFMNMIEEAEEYAKKNLEVCLKSSQNQIEHVYAYELIGCVFYRQKEYLKAISEYEEAIKIAKKKKDADIFILTRLYCIIAQVYEELSDSSKAVYYYEKAAELCASGYEKEQDIQLLIYMSLVYRHLIDCYAISKNNIMRVSLSVRLKSLNQRMRDILYMMDSKKG